MILFEEMAKKISFNPITVAKEIHVICTDDFLIITIFETKNLLIESQSPRLYSKQE